MIMWILVAVAGGLAALVGLWALFQRYRRGEVSARYLLACVVGFIAFAAYAVSSALRPDVVEGLVALLLLAPALIAIVVIVREHQIAHHK